MENLKYIVLLIQFLVVLTQNNSNLEYLTDKNATANDTSIVLENFQNFLIKYNKTYGNFSEFNERLKIFSRNLNKINKSQTNSTINNLTSMKLNLQQGITKFSDLTSAEFEKKYLNNDLNLTAIKEVQGNSTESFFDELKHNKTLKRFLDDNDPVPSYWDWRLIGIITPIKDQGDCGMCWGFAAVANLESQYALKYKKLYSFSEQFLLDCNLEQIGCKGGVITNAWLYLAKNNGIPLDSYIPYTGIRNQCPIISGFTAKVTGYRDAGSQDEEIIKEFLYRHGPVSITMHGNLLQHYKGGIILVDDKTCKPEPMNHACLLVGYGTDASGYDYWIAKNSWGDDWGENGFFRIVRGYKACGMNLYASSSVVS